ncbi:MAG TPA: hypothetical protein VKF60_08515 [Myxococcota bacterium]|nr:hypothetical protein [Myxococcota bacterium]
MTIEQATRVQRIIWGMLTLWQLLAFGASAFRRRASSDGRLRELGARALQSPPEARLTRLLELAQVRLVVSLALNETVALLGFLLAFLNREPSRFWPFLGVALALNALAFPRPARLVERVRELVPQLGTLALLLALGVACSFRGGDFTPMAKEPETPCSREAEAICKEKLGSADIGNCVAREKYRCELLEQEQAKDPAKPAP